MAVIWKEILPLVPYDPSQEVVLDLPLDWVYLHVGPDPQEKPALWFQTGGQAQKAPVKLLVVYTGAEFDGHKWGHLDTFQYRGLMFHLLEDIHGGLPPFPAKGEEQ